MVNRAEVKLPDSVVIPVELNCTVPRTEPLGAKAPVIVKPEVPPPTCVREILLAPAPIAKLAKV